MKYSFLIIMFLVFTNGIMTQNRGANVISIEINGKATTLYTQSYALLIGNSIYTNGWSDLPGVKKDLASVKNALEAKGFKVIENASQRQIKRSIDDFISKYGRDFNSRLIIYYSGHGYTMKRTWGGNMGYIVPSDAPDPNNDASVFKDKAIGMEMFEIYAKRIDSKHVLFLFDCCFSGSLFSLSKAAPAIINYKTEKPVRQFITAGSADEEVPDESIFCQQFIEAINGEADMNNDTYVTGSELGEYIQTTVTNYSYNAQHPQYGKIRNRYLDKGDFVFKIDQSTIEEIIDISSKWEITKPESDIESEKEVFYVVENMPKFNGDLDKYIQNKVASYKDMFSGGGTAYVDFIVEVDGAISDANILRCTNTELNKIALDIVNGFPVWIPGTQRGRIVRVRKSIKIEFQENIDSQEIISNLKPSNNLVAHISNNSGGKISKVVLMVSSAIFIEDKASDKSFYTVTSFSIKISRNGIEDVELSCKGSKFNDEINKQIRTLNKGDTVVIKNIVGLSEDMNYELVKDIEFIIE